MACNRNAIFYVMSRDGSMIVIKLYDDLYGYIMNFPHEIPHQFPTLTEARKIAKEMNGVVRFSRPRVVKNTYQDNA